ncbi:MAG TPA: preprotein translocase subunit SecA, partial [Candidatus Kapabacteria bacterium]|nr:preprotein translocase subunit SecA [Candidatus Kapabacteria bacterium]
MLDFIANIFGSKKNKDVSALQPIADDTNSFFEQYASLTDDELKAKTQEFRDRLRERIGETEDSIADLREQLKQDIGPEEREKIHNEIEDFEKDRKEKTQEFLDEILPEAF